MSNENKALIRRYVDECIARSDVSLMDELLAPEYVWHEPSAGDSDLQAYKRVQPSLRAAFPDGQWTIEDMIAEGDRVAWRYTFCATHLGEFMGMPATGRRLRLTGIVISRIVNGRIAEEWEIYDSLGMLNQLRLR